MPIRPIDMQVAIPKLSEVSRVSHLEQQKAGLQQEQNAVSTNRFADREHRTVMHSDTDSKANTQADAREKGKNVYERPGKKRKNRDEKTVAKRTKSTNKIDIRI